MFFPKEEVKVGQEIFGRVDVTLQTICFVRGIWIKFTAINRIVVDQNKVIASDLLENEQDHHKNGLHEVFIGFGEDDIDEGNLLELQPGHYAWPFSFQLPKASPLSYCDDNIDVTYSLTAVFDCPLLPLTTGSVNYNFIVNKVSKSEVQRSIHTNTKIIGLNGKILSSKTVPQRGNSRSALKSVKNYLLGNSDNHFLTLTSTSGPAIFPFTTGQSELAVQCALYGFNLSQHKKIRIHSGTEN